MPEMPEVETLRRALDAKLRGVRIVALRILWRPFIPASPRVIATAVVGKRITTIRRRGKALIFDLGNEWHLLLHLKMTGQIVLHQHQRLVVFGGHPTANIVGRMPNTWTRVVFALGGGRTLYVNDQRKFARLRVLTSKELAAEVFLRNMGPEILSPEFTLAAFRQRLARHHSAPIKAALLDQRTVAGIGNIYADECLFRAKIHPEQTTSSITAQKLKTL